VVVAVALAAGAAHWTTVASLALRSQSEVAAVDSHWTSAAMLMVEKTKDKKAGESNELPDEGAVEVNAAWGGCRQPPPPPMEA